MPEKTCKQSSERDPVKQLLEWSLELPQVAPEPTTDHREMPNKCKTSQNADFLSTKIWKALSVVFVVASGGFFIRRKTAPSKIRQKVSKMGEVTKTTEARADK